MHSITLHVPLASGWGAIYLDMGAIAVINDFILWEKNVQKGGNKNNNIHLLQQQHSVKYVTKIEMGYLPCNAVHLFTAIESLLRV